ncbi:MAG: hypothetical protein AAFO07_18625 [Bacteroidota bacterium]
MLSDSLWAKSATAHTRDRCFIEMEKELIELIENYPKQLNWDEVNDFDNFDERLSAVNCLVVNTIGVSEGFIEFIPDNNPPLREEVLCWIWVIRPDLSTELMKLDEIQDDFKILLESHIKNRMEKFWDHIS